MKYKFKNKNVLIVGLKKSGMGSVRLLQKLGAFCYLFDDDKIACSNASKQGYNVVSHIDENIIRVMDFVVISPSISVFNEYVKLAKLYGVKVVGELELGSTFARGKKIVVTGTNGKTTTCSLIANILQQVGKSCVLCGNIGEPITQNIMPFKTNYVVEASSFQLESICKLKPQIAVITNITPNHLDRHLNFKNYKQAKCNIYKNMGKRGVLVLNFDDKTLRQIDIKTIKSKIVWVSTKKHIEGYFAVGTKIYKQHKGWRTLLFDAAGLKLVGEHNIQNILFATAVCDVLKIKPQLIAKTVLGFEPINHRIQFLRDVNGVAYVNDSKSTSPQSTITAINSIKKSPIVLILGGSDKNLSFDRLAQKIKKTTDIKLVVVQGQTTQKIVDCLKKYDVKNYVVAQNFADALNVATQNAEQGDTVLLSPACASFDAFENFECRGEKFMEYVKGLSVEN